MPPGSEPPRPRVREAGIVVGTLSPGPGNAITDVAGVRVGHRTLIEGTDVRTGVTAVLPHGGNLFQEKVPAGIAVGNGFGKMTGVTQIAELGTLETPIVLTSTLAVPAAAAAVIGWTLEQPGNEKVTSVNPVVAECNDAGLNDARRRPVREEHVLEALGAASTEPPAEGCVGAGTGTSCLGWKGGIGTASRRVPAAAGAYTIGVLVQTNFGGSLVLSGVPVGEELRAPAGVPGGSCIFVVATDAPLLGRALERVARRALLPLAKVGSSLSHGSGDYALAFSTALRIPHRASAPLELREETRPQALNAVFQAVAEASEEALLNALFRATDLTGFGGKTLRALPVEDALRILARRTR